MVFLLENKSLIYPVLIQGKLGTSRTMEPIKFSCTVKQQSDPIVQ